MSCISLKTTCLKKNLKSWTSPTHPGKGVHALWPKSCMPTPGGVGPQEADLVLSSTYYFKRVFLSAWASTLLFQSHPLLFKWKSHLRRKPRGLIRDTGKHRAEDMDEVGLICVSLPFVWGAHNKRALFLAMDWHCITRYVHWPDKETDSGAPAPNKHGGVLCSKSPHAPGRQTWKNNLNPETFPKQEMEGLWLILLTWMPLKERYPQRAVLSECCFSWMPF